MSYTVACECGRTQSVSASEAGARRSCPCGREIIVPSLRALRQAAGEPVTETPELLIKEMLRDGSVPDGDECVECSVRTDDICYVRTQCETMEVRGRGQTDPLLVVLGGLLFGWLFVRFLRSREDEPRHIGRDVSFRLPLRALRRALARQSLDESSVPSAAL
jgi:hypothetical protein